MKRMYESPMALEERFAANEYIAACITGVIQCAYPGNGSSRWGGTTGKTDVFDDYNGKTSGVYKEPNGLEHGLCGYDAKISFSEDTGSGFEYIGDKIQRNRPIYSIENYKAAPGTYYDVTWKSKDGAHGTGVYNHIGRLKITDIDSHHPNHS